MSAALRHAVLGRRATVRQILAEARPRFWATLGALLLTALAGLGPVLVAFVLCVLLGSAAGGGGAAFGFLLVLAAAVWWLFLIIRLAPLVPVVVLESQGPKDAFTRAWRLNSGNWWRTLGITLLVSLVGSFAAQVVTTPISLLTSTSVLSGLPQPGQTWTVADLPSFSSLWLYVVGSLGATYLSTVLLMPLLPLTNGLLYIDRRIRRESLDVQLAAEAGVTLSTPPPAPQQGYGGWGGQPQYPGQPPYSRRLTGSLRTARRRTVSRLTGSRLTGSRPMGRGRAAAAGRWLAPAGAAPAAAGPDHASGTPGSQAADGSRGRAAAAGRADPGGHRARGE
ncbi:hypothetical protein GXW82_34970 [Streptacidiphilus sp. 4-A2]|nr:hypothetical protein [Streptacidiphilus sp. 4-A2]